MARFEPRLPMGRVQYADGAEQWHRLVFHDRGETVESRCGVRIWPVGDRGARLIVVPDDPVLEAEMTFVCERCFPKGPVIFAVPLRRFALVRHTDATGVSGTGIVAQGVVFTNGRVALSWLTNPGSEAIYQSIGDVVAIHGHDGATTVEYDHRD